MGGGSHADPVEHLEGTVAKKGHKLDLGSSSMLFSTEALTRWMFP